MEFIELEKKFTKIQNDIQNCFLKYNVDKKIEYLHNEINNLKIEVYDEIEFLKAVIKTKENNYLQQLSEQEKLIQKQYNTIQEKDKKIQELEQKLKIETQKLIIKQEKINHYKDKTKQINNSQQQKHIQLDKLKQYKKETIYSKFYN